MKFLINTEHLGKAQDIYRQARLDRNTFLRVSQLIHSRCGIHLEEHKKTMLEGRLIKRLRALGISSFEEYIEHVNRGKGTENEMMHLVDAVTTNKTDFFRERNHFDFLVNILLPQFMRQYRNRTFRIWSAACSTGEEPYTISMVLQDFANQNPTFKYQIEASDISTQVLQQATTAVYHPSNISNIPDAMRQRYLLRSKNKDTPTVRIVPPLRQKVHFFYMNLLDSSREMRDMDVIFCRNVLIYFDRPTQLKVLRNLVQALRPGGFLFIGHSESLHWFDLPLKQIRPTIFTTP